MVIFLKFESLFDLKVFLCCLYLLRDDIKDIFYFIFEYVNDIWFVVLYIEIRNVFI